MRNRCIAIVGTCVVMLALSGCDNNAFHSPLSIRADGNRLLIAMCGPTVEVERIYASARNQETGIDWFRFWDATGTARLETGQVVSTSDGVEGLIDEIDELPILSSRAELAITMVSVVAGKSLSSVFQVGDAGLSDEVWLHTDGESTTDPCDES